jgi:2-polyprenyl-3-methyl-5-hydroxy-6-metoxy-1,4-benzoquinol methylase
MFERISPDQVATQPGHTYRYELAADLIEPGETVIDVACGIGYGAQVMKKRKDFHYIGIDKIEPANDYKHLGHFTTGVDLNTWRPNLTWDVSVCFETLEHLENPQHLANQVMRAKRLIIVSVPTRPTKHFNEYHLHDFTVDDVLTMFAGCDLLHLEDQPEELSHIFVFGGTDAT